MAVVPPAGPAVWGLLQDALEGRPCWVYNGDGAPRLSPRCYTFPDASVTCDLRDRGRVTEVQSPRLIVEMLSDTTEAYDRGDKFSYYRACPSVQEYVLIATKRQAVQVYRLTARGWPTYQAYAPDDMAQLATPDYQLPFRA